MSKSPSSRNSNYSISWWSNTAEHIRYLGMAYVLSLMPQSPLGTPYGQKSYEKSWSSLGSTGTVHRHRSRQLSVGSLASAKSIYAATSWHSTSNHGTPLRSTSYSDLDSGSHPAALGCPVAPSNISRPMSVPPTVPQLVPAASPLTTPVESEFHLGTPVSRTEHSALDLVDEERGDWEEGHALLESETHSLVEVSFHTAVDTPGTPSSKPHLPFKRWISTLRTKKASYRGRNDQILDTLSAPPLNYSSAVTSPAPSTRGHRKSGSWASSLDFITAVKSATVTVATASIAPLSRSASKRSARQRLYRGSSGLLDPDSRFSTDSARPSISLIIDDAARQRAKKRREKIEELIKTEESYISDLKALSSVSIASSSHNTVY